MRTISTLSARAALARSLVRIADALVAGVDLDVYAMRAVDCLSLADDSELDDYTHRRLVSLVQQLAECEGLDGRGLSSAYRAAGRLISTYRS